MYLPSSQCHLNFDFFEQSRKREKEGKLFLGDRKVSLKKKKT